MYGEFFENIKELGAKDEGLVLTCISGDRIGEKAIASGGELKCLDGSGFLSEHREELLKIDKGGIYTVSGERIYAEHIGREKRLIICGGGHVSIALIRMGKLLGFPITVIEDRPLFADNAKHAGADRVICEDFAVALSEFESDSSCYFIVVTRGHQHDRECLRHICRKKYGYIGMMGSKRRVAMVLEGLRQEGISEDTVSAIHSPIGLSIAAETPEEIAVSVMAEIIAVKNGKSRSFGYPEELLCGLLKGSGRRVLCTIVARRGSAPREVGTKLLILSDRTVIGTIGGGCSEAEVVRRGCELLLEDKPTAELFHVDLLDSAAAEEGMVCGGALDVLLETFDYCPRA